MSAALVSIHAVAGDGATGDRIGTGRLFAAALVLVHPPLCRALGDGARGGAALRVGVALENGLVDVLDVVGVHGAGPDEPVLLELSAPSSATALDVDVMAKAEAGEQQRIVDDLLDTASVPAPPPRPLPGGGGGPNDRPFWCKWTGPSGPGCGGP